MQERHHRETEWFAIKSVEEDYEVIIGSLDTICQQAYKKPHNAKNLLYQHLLHVSHGNIYLHITRTWCPTPIPVFTTNFQLPVRFCELTYGTLYIAIDPEKTTIPVRDASRIATICGELLYICEMRILLQKISKLLCSHFSGELTPREQEVLSLLCQGKTKSEIAHLLSIAPRTLDKHKQHIYDKLGVHSDLAVLFAAYTYDLFLPLDSNGE